MSSLRFPCIVILVIPCIVSAQRFDDENPRNPVSEKEECILFGDGFEAGCFDVSNPGPDHPFYNLRRLGCRADGTYDLGLVGW